jgi:hypothetical protein
MTSHEKSGRRWWILALIAIAVVTGFAGWVLHGAPSTNSVAVHPPATAPATTASPVTPPRCATHWSSAPDGLAVPVGDCAGPRDTAGGRARGFSHDQTGAVYAAINITARLSATVGAAVYRPTYAEQTVGDAQSAMSALAQEQSNVPVADTQPSQWWWRIRAGSPTSDLVVVDLAAVTPQSAPTASFAHVPVTLQWVSGDWRVQLPCPNATAISTVSGYTSLGTIPRGDR